jgi:hypothetical protein
MVNPLNNQYTHFFLKRQQGKTGPVWGWVAVGERGVNG